MFTLAFFLASLERAVKSFAQAGAIVVAAEIGGLATIDLPHALSITGAAFVLSLLTSYGSGLIGDATPSLLRTRGDHVA